MFPKSSSATASLLALLSVGCGGSAEDRLSTISGSVVGDPRCGVSGVTISLTGRESRSVVTDGAGGYAFAELSDGTYTVTPTRTDRAFTPENRTVSVTAGSQVAADFDCKLSLTIAGRIEGGEGTIVTASSRTGRPGTTAVVGADGTYALSGLTDGAFSVTPSRIGYRFSPQDLGVNLLDASVSQQDFTSLPPLDPFGGRWSWVSPRPQDNALRGVWGSSSTDAWAVGVDGTILRWNGSDWSVHHTRAATELDGVWGSAPDDVWVVGSDGGVGMILRWDGAAWSSTWAAPAAALRAIWGSAPDDVWAVGEATVHWDGTSWSFGGPCCGLNGIWGSSRSDVWAVGPAGRVEHWDGVAWSRVATGAVENLTAVWGSSDRDVTVVGDGVVLHWNGHGWQKLNFAGRRFSAVGGSSASDVWALAGDTFLHVTATSAQLLHVAGTYRALWVNAANDLWAVGDAGAILRRLDGSWQRHDTRMLPSTFSATKVWGSARDDAWILGTSADVFHWDGSAWSPVPTGTSALLHAIWGSAANDLWAVGGSGGGVIRHWDGAAWSTAHEGTVWDLYLDVGGTGASDVWVVGLLGAILHWDGAGWSSVPSPTASSLQAVWVRAIDDAWAVGDGGTIARWDGATWTSVSSPTTQRLWDVWGSSANDAWAVGEGAILHWDGEAWSIPWNVESCPLFAVWGFSPNDVWAVGRDSYAWATRILHWDGTAWSGSTTGQGSLIGVWGAAANDVWAVGQVALMRYQ